MTDNLNINENLIPYKEIAKKRALEYYHANKVAISQKKEKNDINSYLVKIKRSY